MIYNIEYLSHSDYMTIFVSILIMQVKLISGGNFHTDNIYQAKPDKILSDSDTVKTYIGDIMVLSKGIFP